MLVPNATVVSTRRSSPRRSPPTPATCSPAGRSRCSTRSRPSCPARSSRSRRRWRAATAPATAASCRATAATSGSASRAPSCGPRLPQSSGVRILNASGCLDALVAPDVARSLDAFVTKTITPLPRGGNPPARIAETEGGMLNSIGLQGPGIDAFVESHLPRLAESRDGAVGLGRRVLGGATSPLSASGSTARRTSPSSS